MIMNRIQPSRTFGMLSTHVMKLAIAVGNESGRHKSQVV